MCKCTPNIRTPFCGKGDCVWPHEKKEVVIDGIVYVPKNETSSEPELRKISWNQFINAIGEARRSVVVKVSKTDSCGSYSEEEEIRYLDPDILRKRLSGF